MSMFVMSFLFLITGALYLVFAYREPPKAIEHFFRIPAIFTFFPEPNRVKLGRIAAGALLVVAGVGELLRELYCLVLRWS
jgi:hypothetical protein